MSHLAAGGTMDGPKIRLLICHTCKIVQPVPLWDGPAEHDELLMARIAEHQFPVVHVGNDVEHRPHDLDVGRVPDAAWNDPGHQRQLIREIMANTKGVGAGEGLGDELYDARGNYSDDAMKCWRIGHNRTSDCGDWMSDKMTILADSASERKDLGLDTRTRAKIKLCQFCVMASVKRQKVNKAKGLYG